MATKNTKHKKLSMKKVFGKTKPRSYKKAIKELTATTPDENVILAKYTRAIKKSKKTAKL